ncbi:MAG: hypothetical protein GF313_09525 [Caldithrix sp.]|nr:hypothetical protein [Caldithrix sp.]
MIQKNLLSIIHTLLVILVSYLYLSFNLKITLIVISYFSIIIILTLLLYVDNIQKLLVHLIIASFPFLNIQSEISHHFYFGIIDIFMVPIVIFMWYKILIGHYKKIKRSFSLLFLFIFILLVWGLLKSDYRILNIRYIMYFVYSVTFFRMIIDELNSINDLKSICSIILIISLYPILIAFFEFYSGSDITALLQIGGSLKIDQRVSGPMSVNGLGFYLGVNIIFLLLYYEITKRHLIFAFFLLLYLITIYLSGSRAAFLFAFINLAGYVYLRVIFTESKNKLIYFLMSNVAIIILLFIGYYIFLNRLQGTMDLRTDFAFVTRIFIWKAALDLFLTDPISGIGLGNFVLYHENVINYDVKIFLLLGGHYHAHNLFLHLLATTGLIGFLGTLSFVSYVGYKIIQKIRNMDFYYRKILLGIILIAFLGYLISQQFDLLVASPSHSRAILLTVLLLGITHNFLYKKIITNDYLIS